MAKENLSCSVPLLPHIDFCSLCESAVAFPNVFVVFFIGRHSFIVLSVFFQSLTSVHSFLSDGSFRNSETVDACVRRQLSPHSLPQPRIFTSTYVIIVA